MNPKYSICVTHYNNAPTLRQSLDGVLNQIDDRFEVIIVDNLSSDGSANILQDYSSRKKITLIRRRCSRGMARQTAFENSNGDYVIANLDMDDVVRPSLVELLDTYHSQCDGHLLWVRSIDSRGFWGGENFTIAPRGLLTRVGGWRDLQFGEDWELVRRVARVGAYRWCYFQLFEQVNSHPERKTLVGRIMFRYARYRDLLRCGRPVFETESHISITQRVPLLLAKLSMPFYESYGSCGESVFEPYSREYFIDFGERPAQH